MRSKRLFPAILFAATWFLFAAVAPAHAQSSAESMARAWIDGLRAQGTEISYGRIDFEPIRDRLRITDLKISGGTTPYRITATSVEIDRLAPRSGGGFTASSLEIPQGTLSVAGIEVRISGLRAREFGAPSLAGLVFDQAKPMTSMLAVIALQKEFSAKRAEIARLVYSLEVPGGNPADRSAPTRAEVVYRDILFRDVANGRGAEISVAGIDGDIDTPEGAVKITYGAITATGIDFGVYDHVLNPANYVNGKGDGVWRPVLENAVMDGLEMTLPQDVGVRMGAVVMTGMKMRQSAEDPAPLLELLDRVMTDPKALDDPEKAKEIVPQIFGIYGMMRLDLMRMSNLEISGPDIEKAGVGAIILRDLSSAGMGEFRIDGVDVVARDNGETVDFKLGAFSIADVGFPALSALLALDEPGAEKDPRRVMAALPTVGRIALEGFSVQPPGEAGRLSLGSWVLEMGRFVNNIPTSLHVRTENAVIPRALVEKDNPEAAAAFVAFGLNEIDYSDEVALDWKPESKTITLGPIRFAIKGVATISLAASLAGLGPEVLENPGILPASAMGLTVSEAKVQLVNDGGVQSALAFAATQQGVPADQFSATLVAMSEAILIPVLGEQFAKTVRDALERFLADPQSLSVSIAPQQAVPILQIIGFAQQAPQQLPGLLGVQIGVNQ